MFEQRTRTKGKRTKIERKHTKKGASTISKGVRMDCQKKRSENRKKELLVACGDYRIPSQYAQQEQQKYPIFLFSRKVKQFRPLLDIGFSGKLITC